MSKVEIAKRPAASFAKRRASSPQPHICRCKQGAKSIDPLWGTWDERRLPVAEALLPIAFVVGNAGVDHRPPARPAALGCRLGIRAATIVIRNSMDDFMADISRQGRWASWAAVAAGVSVVLQA